MSKALSDLLTAACSGVLSSKSSAFASAFPLRSNDSTHSRLEVRAAKWRAVKPMD